MKLVMLFLKISNFDLFSCNFQVVKETLRMSNVLLWFPRVALKDCTIEGLKTKFAF